jgi:exopolysaccharide production protein ExoQ
VSLSDTHDRFRLPRLSRARTRHRDDRPRWAEALAQFAFGALIVLAIAGPWMTNQGDETLSKVRELGYAAICILTAAALRPWRHVERLLVVPWPLLLSLGYCALSLLWAIEPGLGARRLTLTAIVLWAVFALVRYIGPGRSATILRVLMAALLLINFSVALRYPAIGIHGPGEADLAGNWRGIMGQKNFAGFTCAMTIVLFAFPAQRVAVAARIGIIGAAAVFLLLSHSATSLGVGIVALVAGALFDRATTLRGQSRLAAPAWTWVPLAVVGVIFVSMAIAPSAYVDFLRDPAGFTGRYGIWTALIQLYADRPWLGVGYGSLWDLGSGGPIHAYAHGWVAEVSQGHNGYLDLLAQIGAPGTLVVLFATLVWPLQRLLRGGDQRARVFSAATIVFCLGHNFTETSLFDRDTLGQIFLLIAIAMLWNSTTAEPVPTQETASPWRDTKPRRKRRSTFGSEAARAG